MQSFYDVIVVGGGGAALCAALAAKEEGVSVLLVSKTAVGKANCTAFAGGGFSFAGPGTSWKDHQKKTLETGRWMNDPDLVDSFCKDGPLSVLNLQRFNMKSYVRSSGCSVSPYAPNSRVGGMGMTLPLLQACKEMGVDLLPAHIVHGLQTQHDHASAVELTSMITGKSQVIPCHSIVIATGGGGRVYGRTNNPVTTTGDGYHMLHELGLAFRDMEFVQFYPMGLAEEALPMWFIDLGIIDQVPLTDENGNEFLLDLLHSWGIATGREGNLYARDRTSIAIAEKWDQGNPPLLHLEKMPAEKWQQRYYKELLMLNRDHFDFTKRPIRVRPLVHYMSGGVQINPLSQTEIPGIFACGEVTGGVDGANRIGGNALTNISHFGQIAGKGAAKYAKEASHTPSVQPISSLPGNKGTENLLSLKTELHWVMDNLVGPLRSGEGLLKAKNRVEELKERSYKTAWQTPKELQNRIELTSMLTTAQMIIEGALQRQESRGVHFRKDYPTEREELNQPIWQRK